MKEINAHYHQVQVCLVLSQVALSLSFSLGNKHKLCGTCSGCTAPDCRSCDNCFDMKKYDGPGKKKKCC